MSVLISAILPIALVALVGFCLGRNFELNFQTLARVNIYAMLPALVLTSLAKASITWSSAIALIAAFLLNTMLLYLVVIVISARLKLSIDQRKSLTATTLFANVGNMGLPFVLFSLGEAGLDRAVIYLVGSSVMVATLFPILLKGRGLRIGLTYTLRLPVLWATLLGLALQWSHRVLPDAIARGVTLLGNGSIPLALLSLGIQLSLTQLKFGVYELLGTILRLVLSPFTAYGLGRLVGLSGLDLQVLVLQAAMPAAVNSLIWVTELGGDTTRVARTIILSTLLSFLSLPCVLWLTSQ